MVDEVHLTLSRLGDPARTGRRRNLTLETLAEEIEQLGEAGLALVVRQKLEAYRDACDLIVERRNRRIAHYDWQTHQPASTEGLQGPSRAEIKNAMDALRILMRAVFEHFEHSYMAYEHFVMNDDGENLMLAVAQALRYRELRESGAIPHTDFAESESSRVLRRPPPDSPWER
jgi:hypothetical protein